MDTSPFAYEYALRNMRKHPASSKVGDSGAMGETHQVKHAGGVYGPLLWLYRLFLKFTFGEEGIASAPDYKDEAFVSKYSRATRRLIKQNRLFLDLQKIKNQLYIDRLMFAGLTPSQEQEKRARISPRGRIAVYGLRYWGTRFQARARLSCYDHGWWRVPHTSAVNSGMWDVQLPPN